MAVTDLTGTIWVINAMPTPIASTLTAYINFTSNSAPFTGITLYDDMDFGNIAYRNPETLEFPIIVYDSETWAYDSYRTLSITGGADATNATLIAWLGANAEQQIPTVPDVSISYNGGEIASMSDSGTKVLKTQGKYCTDDITIDYTKSGGGGGDEQLFIFCNSTAYLNAGATINNNFLSAKAAYYGAALVSGATVTFYTYGDYILTGVTGWKSGDAISFTTVQRGTYTFTMPSESVNCTIYYDD